MRGGGAGGKILSVPDIIHSICNGFNDNLLDDWHGAGCLENVAYSGAKLNFDGFACGADVP